MKSPFLLFLLLFLAGLVCCTDKKQINPPLLELLPSSETGITFNNVIREDNKLNIITFEYLYNGAGVGLIDINNDGLQDIFFTANMSENKLYLNKGDFHFEDISHTCGLIQSGKWATGVSIVDINQDGWQDIYVCYAGPYADAEKRSNELYINNRDNTFDEKAKSYGLNDTGHSVQAAFFDYDRDGDLDVYILTNITDQTGPNVIRAKRLNGEMANTDRLYRNNGDNTYTNVSREAGILAEGYGLGVSVCDINDDGWDDIYVSNDYLSNDLMYINQKNGTFIDRASAYFDHTSYSAMGNDVSDYNNDGLSDIISVDMLPPDNKRQKLMFGATSYDRYRSEIRMGYAPQFMRNTLQLGRGSDDQGAMVFSEIGQFAGVSATDWSWSPLFMDVDNDGWRDLLITNGYPRDITNRDFASYKASEFVHQGFNQGLSTKLMEEVNKLDGAYLPNFAFRNNGDLTFSDSSSAWGFSLPSYSTGAAYGDLDNDGDLDYITNNSNGVASVFRNNSDKLNQNHYIRLLLEGPEKNKNGLGTDVQVVTAQHRIFATAAVTRGFQSSVEQTVHFGIGRDSLIKEIEILWPDQSKQTLRDVRADQTLVVKYSNRDTTRKSRDSLPQNMVFHKTRREDISFVHHESHYVDFKIQPLIPNQYSQQGPALAVADANGDGRDDFFLLEAPSTNRVRYSFKRQTENLRRHS